MNASHISLALLIPLIGGLFVAVGHLMQNPTTLSDPASWRDLTSAVVAICGLVGVTLPSWLYVLPWFAPPKVAGELPRVVDPK